MAEPTPAASRRGIAGRREGETNTRHKGELIENVVGVVVIAIIVAVVLHFFPPGDAFGPDDHFLPAPYR